MALMAQNHMLIIIIISSSGLLSVVRAKTMHRLCVLVRGAVNAPLVLFRKTRCHALFSAAHADVRPELTWVRRRGSKAKIRCLQWRQRKLSLGSVLFSVSWLATPSYTNPRWRCVCVSVSFILSISVASLRRWPWNKTPHSALVSDVLTLVMST